MNFISFEPLPKRIRIENKSQNINLPIRNLCVVSTEAITVDKVRAHFERFGEVEFVQWNKINEVHHGFVQFKSNENAKVVLQSHHCIGNVIPRVTAADAWLQPDFQLILRILNDDCLKEVFLRLELIDLCNIAEVCVRFKNAAKEAFAQKYKYIEIDRLFDCKQVDDIQQANDMERVFSYFGSAIYSLDSIDNERMLELVCRYCVIESRLKELEITDIHLTKDLVEKLRPIFARLKKLTISCTFDDDVKNSFSSCTNLESLMFMNMSDERYENEILFELIKNNTTLTDLYVCTPSADTTGLFQIDIPRYLPNLLNFSCDTRFENLQNFLQNDIQHLTKLSSLNELQIHFNSQDALPLLKSLTLQNLPIKTLTMREAIISDEAVESICKMKDLETVCLCSIHNMTKYHLIDLAKLLPKFEKFTIHDGHDMKVDLKSLKKILSYAKKLKHLRVESDAVVNSEEYQNILKVLQCREVKTHLKLGLSGGTLSVCKDILLQNRHLISIKASKYIHE